jgi:4'-phosphopantetheinyl transferase
LIDHIKAVRFHRKLDRLRFLFTRLAVRRILSGYLNLDPRKLEFSYNARGKPSIMLNDQFHPLRFNLSHSGELALCAVTYDLDLGIDVEKICNDFSISEIAEYIFSPAEAQIFQALPSEQRQEAFFRCWTRKEAYIKAIGGSLGKDSHSFEVPVSQLESAGVLSINSNKHQEADWVIHDLKVEAGYIGSLVTRDGDKQKIEYFNYSSIYFPS